MTGEEYLDRERAAVSKSELVNGQMIAMAGVSPRHNGIVRNLLIALGTRLRGKSCQPYPSDLRVHVPATGLYTYPDVTVACGPLEHHPKDTATILNPRVLIEVLSDRTEAFDRGAKFAHYRSIASLSTYVLVSSDEARVEWYVRGDDGVFGLHEAVGSSATMALDALAVTIPIAELYADLPAD
jgi:Uma2 family endonuclease